MNKKTLVSILVVVIFIMFLFVLISAQTNKNKAQVIKTVCPYVYAEDKNLEVIMNKCVQAYSEVEKDYKLDGLYKVSEILIESKDGKIVKTYTVDRNFEVDFGLPRIQEDKNNSFLFLDEGTSAEHGLTIFSLKDDRLTTIIYHSTPILIKNEYLVYETPSNIYQNVHPEVEESSAMDIAVVKLSDFNMRYLAKGTENTSFYLKAYESNKEVTNPNQIIKITDDDNVIIQKVVWKNPLRYEEGQTTTESSVSPGFLYEALSSSH